MIEDQVIGATLNRSFEADAGWFRGNEEERVMVYEFNIAVDPKHQGGTVGYLLTKASIKDAELISHEHKDIKTVMNNSVVNPVMAKMLKKIFNFKYLFEDDPNEGNRYKSKMYKYIN